MSDSAAGPLVTIGIATFNRLERTLPAALASALAQTYPNLEVVVCDNASEDGTDAFMAAQSDPRLRYHRHQRNIGANANFNACLERARGTWFLLLPDDDLLEPDFVERAMTALGDASAGVLLGGMQVIDGSGEVTDRVRAPEAELGPAGLFLAWFARRTSFYLMSTLFHGETLRAAGGFASPEGLLQDVVAIARTAARRGYVPVPGVAGSFRRHEGNRGTANHAVRWTRDADHLLDVLRQEMPHDAKRLLAAGSPYLTAKCYRYVAAVPSLPERWRLYREIHRRLGRTYSPWFYLARRAIGGARTTARRLLWRQPPPATSEW